jgi:predicted protein tyrosine phosphatase
MEMHIKSRWQIENDGTKVDKPHVLISIRSPGIEDIDIVPNDNMLAVLPIAFHDTDKDYFNEAMGISLTAITLFHARKIKAFVDEWKDKVEAIVCHCEAGISRSSGTAAAIAVYLDGPGADVDIFDNKKYVPNMKVYNMLLNAFGLGFES